MNYLEIILKNVKKYYVDQIIGKYLQYNVSDVISSYFYDKNKQKNIEYSDIENLQTYFNESGTCNIYLKIVQIGMELIVVLILVGYDGDNGDITLNFLEEQFRHMEKGRLKSNLCMFIQKLVELCKCCDIDQIILGYEPAEDDDMKIMEIRKEQITIFNEDIHRSEVIQVLYNIVNDNLMSF